MPNSNPTTTDAPDDGAAVPASLWLSSRDAAKALDVSEKTVWRRAKAGTLPARKVASGRGGALVWEVALVPTGQQDNGTDKSNRTTGQPTGQSNRTKAEFEREPTGQTDRTATGQPDKPTGQNDANGRGEVEAELRAQLAREREFSGILKAQLEAVTQSEAQTKAALREALRAMPKALTAGESSTTHPTPTDAPQRAQKHATTKNTGADTNGSRRPTGASEVTDWNSVYRAIADELNGA